MSSSSASTNNRPLNRGAACLPCRKLKAKCDGNRPACARCIANNRPDDCEYAIGAEVTRSRLLEENIALLEARIRELENPGESAPSVTLHHPRGHGGGMPSAVPSRPRTPMAGPSSMTLYPANVGQPLGEEYRLPQSWAYIDWFSCLPPVLPASMPDPTSQEVQTLLQIFMANASQLGFFLNPTRFQRRPPSHDALRNAVFLWGSRLSLSPALRAREAHFADAATQAAAGTTLGGSTPPHVLHTVQAEVLLANYFFATGRLLEGRYHCLAAVALVTASRFHLLNIGMMGADPVADGENIHAFWTVVSLDKTWAAMMNTPPSLSLCGRGGIQVTTPWPLSTEAYEQGLVVQPHGGNYSMDEFIRGTADDSNEDFSPLAIRTKAGALYERALYISSQYRPDMPNRNDFLAQFNGLDDLIERFYRHLAGVRPRGSNSSGDDARELLVSRTLACAAGIQLHSVFAGTQRPSWQRTVRMALSATRALDVVDVAQYQHLDPVVAILWATICNVLINELRRIRQSAPAPQEEANVISGLDRVSGAMSTLSFSSALMGSRLAEIQQARAALN